MSEFSRKRFIVLNLSPLILAVILSIAVFSLAGQLPKKLPLFYSLPWGESQTAGGKDFFIIPAVIVSISLTNLILSLQLHKTQTFFKRILLISSIISSLILTITLVKIFFIFI